MPASPRTLRSWRLTLVVVSSVPSRLRNTSASSEWSAIIASRRRSASAVKDGSAITWYCSHALMTAWIALTSVAVSAVGVCFGYVMGNRWDRISPPKRKSRSTMG